MLHVAYEWEPPTCFLSLCWAYLYERSWGILFCQTPSQREQITTSLLTRAPLTAVASWARSATDPALWTGRGVVGSWGRMIYWVPFWLGPCPCPRLWALLPLPASPRSTKVPHKPHARSAPFTFACLQLPVCLVPEAGSESNQSHCSAISDGEFPSYF